MTTSSFFSWLLLLAVMPTGVAVCVRGVDDAMRASGRKEHKISKEYCYGPIIDMTAGGQTNTTNPRANFRY
jgi:hypothetical protein